MFSITQRVGVALAVACTVVGISAASAMAIDNRNVVIASLNSSEYVGTETFGYTGTCVGGPGASTGGPGSKVTYVFSLQGTATSSDLADPAISTAATCNVHYLGGATIKEFGRTLAGGSSAWYDTVDVDPRYRIEVCVTVGANFFNGHNGAKSQCTVPW
ncbi:MAG: hypothetical protein QOJ29_4445 [Thermoleophilaceae bacterium]|jgi:hypothetical protein|nr:hypothetical protein [Thermoleophilaceae bacterium]